MEFEYSEDELYHYGRKGMKWGQNIFGKAKARKTAKKRKKNLEKAREAKAKAKQEAEDKETKKSEIIKSRSARKLYENADLFTTQELQTAFQRLELEKKIKDIAPKEVSKGERYIQKFKKIGDNINDIVNTSTKLYKASATVYNTFSEKGATNPWQQIKNRENKQREKAAEAAAKEKDAKKAAKQAEKESKQKMKEAKKTYDEANKTEEYEVFTGKVSGKGTSTSKIKNGESWVGSKDFDIEIDFDDPSPAMARAAEAGATYVAGLLEKLED